MSLIQLQNLSKSHGKKTVLRNIYFRVAKGDRVGLVGKNGAGKTTILRLFLKREEPDEGDVQIEDGVRIGYFSQFSELSGEQTVEDVLETLFGEIKTIEAELKEIEEQLQKSAANFDELLARQAELFEKMQQLDDWTYANRIDTVLTRLGFNSAHRRRPIDQLSGGWRNRAALAKILLEDPDVLLLDEPTNYLDVEGLDWLENWLDGLCGALVLVSHDRHFLDRVVKRALIHFPGAIIAVSHDRFFIDKIANRLLVFEEGARLRPVEGNWSIYQGTLSS